MRIWVAIAVALLWFPIEAWAQSEDTQHIFFVNVPRVLRDSLIGQELERRITVRQRTLREINDQTVAALLAEEEQLTQDRETMDIETFTPLAEAFDQKSNAARENMDRISDQANREFRLQQQRFTDLVLLETQRLAIERGGATILNSANTVIALSEEDDLTDILIAKLNTIYQNDPSAIENAVFQVETDTPDLVIDVELDAEN